MIGDPEQFAASQLNINAGPPRELPTSGSVLADIEIGSIYAMFWRMLYTAKRRYSSNSTAELLTFMTINLMDQAGYRPTISELVELTGLEKSAVSRYVSGAIEKGFLTEVMGPKDRRLRRLRPTAMGRKIGASHRRKMLETARLSTEALRGKGNSKDPVTDLKDILLDLQGDPSIYSECRAETAVQKERT